MLIKFAFLNLFFLGLKQILCRVPYLKILIIICVCKLGSFRSKKVEFRTPWPATKFRSDFPTCFAVKSYEIVFVSHICNVQSEFKREKLK